MQRAGSAVVGVVDVVVVVVVVDVVVAVVVVRSERERCLRAAADGLPAPHALQASARLPTSATAPTVLLRIVRK